MRRFVILGNAGSGKSTLARRLGARLDLPVVHLDRLFWQPGWVEPENDAFRARVAEAIAGDAWVCEGNYGGRTLDLRLPRAELVVWLDTPRWVCLWRVIRRACLRDPRPDLAPGCEEKLNGAFAEFLAYVWRFDSGSRLRIEAQRLANGPEVPVVNLKTRRQVEAFVSAVA